jgi:hypothetical protein
VVSQDSCPRRLQEEIPVGINCFALSALESSPRGIFVLLLSWGPVLLSLSASISHLGACTLPSWLVLFHQ